MVSLTGDVATGKVDRPEPRPTRSSACTSSSAARRRSIVFDDADLEALVATLTETGYYNSGQDCTAPCRVLAGPGVFDDFVAALTDSVGKIVTGDPLDEDTAMGPVVSGEQLARVAGHGRPGARRRRRGHDRRRGASTAPASSTSRRSS